MLHSKLLIALPFCILMSILSSSVVGQDELETARAYPPRFLNNSQLTTNQAVIDWKIEQLESLMNSYLESRNEIDVGVDSASAKVKFLVNKLPGELRFMDKETRSRLVGKLMESLLDARLELASRTKEIEALEDRLINKEDEPRSKTELMLSEIAIEAANRKLEVASVEASKAEKLAENGSKSNSERLMALYTKNLAELELKKAVAQFEMLKNQPKADAANQVADARVGVEPIKARIAAAEKFLSTFTESSDVISKIDSINRSIELYEKDRQMVASEMSSLARDLQELKMLRGRISDHMKTIEKSKKEKKQERDNN